MRSQLERAAPQARTYELAVTTQGPAYPPSEVMDGDGNFVVIGRLNRRAADGTTVGEWGNAIVAADSPCPPLGENAPYAIREEFELPPPARLARTVLHTLPLPLPCTNYPMAFAPAQVPDAASVRRPSYPFHATPIPDLRAGDGRRRTAPVTLGEWVRARGSLAVSVSDDGREGCFAFAFANLIPDSLYTVMALRAHDLDPSHQTRPGPLGVPNVFVTDAHGGASYAARMPAAFPDPDEPGANRIVNVVVLWMSYQMSHGGAIGVFGLGGDIHAQLKLPTPSFHEFRTA